MKNSEAQWLTLNEASTMTGIKIPTLRMGIKRGKYSGERLQTANGHKWLIDASSLSIRDDGVRPPPPPPAESDRPDYYARTLLSEQRERIDEQAAHIASLDSLAALLRQRISLLESENRQLQKKLDLLPGPVEEVMKTLIAQKQRTDELEEALQEAEIRHEKEKKKAWW